MRHDYHINSLRNVTIISMMSRAEVRRRLSFFVIFLSVRLSFILSFCVKAPKQLGRGAAQHQAMLRATIGLLECAAMEGFGTSRNRTTIL